MADTFVPLSQRTGYTTAQMRLLFGRFVNGRIEPLHECTIARWRKAGRIPYAKINERVFRYPREKIDAILRAQEAEETAVLA